MFKAKTQQILIVDDCPAFRKLSQHIIESQHADYELFFAEDGLEALSILNQEDISLVLTDYQMPGISGLDLAKLVDKNTPVFVVTANDDIQVEIDAMLNGVDEFIHKSQLAQELPKMLQAMLPAAVEGNTQKNRPAISCIHDQETQFVIPNDCSMVPDIVEFCQGLLSDFKICSRQDQIRVGIAIEEAVVNGIIHGNLEVSSELRGIDDDAHFKLIERRMNQRHFASRKLSFNIHMTTNLARLVIRDQGPGFDVSGLPDPTDEENLYKASGRGVLLIRSFMDEMSYNKAGNEITMIKYKTVPDEDNSACPEYDQKENSQILQIQ